MQMQQVQQPITVEELKENGQTLTQEFRLRDQNGQEMTINIKLYGTFDEPLFRAADIERICQVTNIRKTIREYDQDEGFIAKPNCSEGISQYFLTEAGLYRYLGSSRSEVGKAFRKFVTQLLHGLRTGKLQLMETENIQLKNAREQLQQQLLLTNQEIQERETVIEEQKQEIQQKTEEIIQKDLDFDVLDGEYDILHESASQICQKERTKIPQNRAKHEFLMIIRIEEENEDVLLENTRYRACCVQRYKRNQLLRKNYDDTVFNRQCVSAKQFWNSCNEIMIQNGHKTDGICQFQLINGYTQDQLYDFLTNQIDIMHQVPDQ